MWPHGSESTVRSFHQRLLRLHFLLAALRAGAPHPVATRRRSTSTSFAEREISQVYQLADGWRRPPARVTKLALRLRSALHLAISNVRPPRAAAAHLVQGLASHGCVSEAGPKHVLSPADRVPREII
jgi:hypothetical protein